MKAILLERLGWTAAGMSYDDIEEKMPVEVLEALLEFRAGVDSRKSAVNPHAAAGDLPGVAFGSIED